MASYQSQQVSEVYDQYNSKRLVDGVLIRNASGSKLRLVVSCKCITNRKTYVKLATH